MQCKYKIFPITILSLILLNACSAGIINLEDAKSNVEKYYTDGTYEKELDVIIEDAIHKIPEVNPGNKETVIFDVDETTLSNFEYAKSMSYGYDLITWKEWVNKSKAPAIKQVKRFYDVLVNKGFIIIFLSGRNESEYAATEKNLINAGYKNFDTLIVRNSIELNYTTAKYKYRKRKELADRGYNIIYCVGDQESDFWNGYTGTIIKLPNYLYKME